MKNCSLLIMLIGLFISTFAPAAGAKVDEKTPGWKAGVARLIITPKESMWLAGYAARDHASEGTIHDLWAKALVLEDASGQQAVIITTDLLGIPRNMSDRIRNQLKTKYQFSRAQIIINSSHTHSAPVLEDALIDIYSLSSVEEEKIQQYSDRLVKNIVGLVGEARKSMEPVELYSGNGVTRFQVNRRNNANSMLYKQTELKGPNDYAVPVMQVVDKTGHIMAILFGYACHPTVLRGYQWSGDYAGFAQLALEKLYPGTTALFFQGAGADQNPLPRHSVALAQQYGQTLAAAVNRVLAEHMRKLSPTISTAYAEVDLPLNESPTDEELSEMSKTLKGYQQQWALRLLNEVRNGKELIKKYPYPLQVWTLGDQMLVALGGELVVEYAIGLKKMFGHDLFVMGYANDVMGYIPSSTILQEGGYEGEISQRVYGLPGKWDAGIDSLIYSGIKQLAEELRDKNN